MPQATRSFLPILAALATILFVPASSQAGQKVLAHDVFFTLVDSSPEAVSRLVKACRTYLGGHDGTVFFATGSRAAEMQRAVNDQEYDVALHIFFRDSAAHDAYQESARHKAFIEEQKANWKRVRVFDSWVETGATDMPVEPD